MRLSRWRNPGLWCPASHPRVGTSYALSDISQITPKFREIVPPFHRQGNCIPSAAIRWPDFGDRPSFGRPFAQIFRHSDTPLLSRSPRRRFPRRLPNDRLHAPDCALEGLRTHRVAHPTSLVRAAWSRFRSVPNRAIIFGAWEESSGKSQLKGYEPEGVRHHQLPRRVKSSRNKEEG